MQKGPVRDAKQRPGFSTNLRDRMKAFTPRIVRMFSDSGGKLTLSLGLNPAMDSGKGNGLSPPVRVSAMGEKAVDERVIDLARFDEVAAKFLNGLAPVFRPGRTAVVDSRFGSASELLETVRSEARGQNSADVIVDPLLTGPD